MRIISSEYTSLSKVPPLKYEVGFLGEIVDKRGEEAEKYLRNNCKNVFHFFYNPKEFYYNINGEIYEEREAKEFISLINSPFMVESTSLGFSELYRIAESSKSEYFSILYCEPIEYHKPNNINLTPYREFSLSAGSNGIYPITDRMVNFSDDKIKRGIIMLGYEDHRIDRLFEDYEIDPTNCEIIVGLPAFNAGWELNTYSNNIDVLLDRNLSRNIHYSAANSPVVAYKLLQNIHRSLFPDEKLFIAPMGTKPHGIAAALFSANNSDTSLVYDHPRRLQGRSKDIAKIHLYKVYK